MAQLSLVTGANGHLGNNLVRALVDRGDQVRASVRNARNRAPFDGVECEVVEADLLDGNSLLRALEGVHTLYQVAAVVKHWSRNAEQEVLRPAVEGTRNLLQAAAQQGVGRIVYVSSEITLGSHDSPVDESSWRTDFFGNPYARAKTESEHLAWTLAGELGLDLVSTLPGTMVGPYCFKLTPTMRYLQQALKGAVFLDINLCFNFVDVRDVAAGMIAAAEHGRSGERYLLATEEAVSNRRLLELAQEFNPKIKMPRRAPRFALMAVAGAMELVSRITRGEPRLASSQVRIFYGNTRRMDLSKARTELGYHPRDPETALRQAFEYLRGPW
ncbi:MAG: NAD-dependent epimerase/dehydratase family protein [Thermoanaerobaculales bacterium]|nr:NAD-dependent epimerase/dehydratase family protein [Thermoanaerobaculales bacterium]